MGCPFMGDLFRLQMNDTLKKSVVIEFINIFVKKPQQIALEEDVRIANSVYGIQVIDSLKVIVRMCTISVDDGVDGKNGKSDIHEVDKVEDGGTGDSGCEAGSTEKNCQTCERPVGGTFGVGCGKDESTRGGRGGVPSSKTAGTMGETAPGGGKGGEGVPMNKKGWLPSLKYTGQNGDVGKQGRDGSAGLPHFAPHAYSVVGIIDPTDGSNGRGGGGGGGGGAGTIAHENASCPAFGGSGGGGGGGGCGGARGKNGQSGGGSFGIWISGSTVEVEYCYIVTGKGGNGGAGSEGQPGTYGGRGGKASKTLDDSMGTASRGAPGGAGGQGGRGGHGDGGNGGPSIAIVYGNSDGEPMIPSLKCNHVQTGKGGRVGMSHSSKRKQGSIPFSSCFDFSRQAAYNCTKKCHLEQEKKRCTVLKFCDRCGICGGTNTSNKTCTKIGDVGKWGDQRNRESLGKEGNSMSSSGKDGSVLWVLFATVAVLFLIGLVVYYSATIFKVSCCFEFDQQEPFGEKIEMQSALDRENLLSDNQEAMCEDQNRVCDRSDIVKEALLEALRARNRTSSPNIRASGNESPLSRDERGDSFSDFDESEQVDGCFSYNDTSSSYRSVDR
eukprot:Nk52_evm49s151 gene=Nk52_evmTU49s151